MSDEEIKEGAETSSETTGTEPTPEVGEATGTAPEAEATV
jgi:hypothetical protein